MGSAPRKASSDDALAHRIKNEFRNAVDTELLENMGAMRLDCIRQRNPTLTAARYYC